MNAQYEQVDRWDYSEFPADDIAREMDLINALLPDNYHLTEFKGVEDYPLRLLKYVPQSERDS